MGTPGSSMTNPNPNPNPNPKPRLKNLGDSLNRVFLLALRYIPPTIQQPTRVKRHREEKNKHREEETGLSQEKKTEREEKKAEKRRREKSREILPPHAM